MRAMLIALTLIFPEFAVAQVEPKRYELGTDSQRQDGVPRGDLTMHVWRSDKVYAGTVRAGTGSTFRSSMTLQCQQR